MAVAREMKSWTNRQGAPATIAIIALMILSSLFWLYSHMRGAEHFVASNNWAYEPWQLITYPFAYTPLENGMGLVFFVFMVAWLLFAGRSLEHDLGTPKFVGLWVSMTILPALLIGLYANFRGVPFAIAGPYLPVEAVTIAWCTRNAGHTILLYGFIPLMGKWLGWITAAMVFWLFWTQRPEYGPLATLPLILAWLFASNRLPVRTYDRPSGGTSRQVLKKHERMDKSYFEDVKRREEERAERERLRKMFEDSLEDDDK